jgi:hypothetical protein
MSEIGRTFSLVFPAMLSLPIGLIQAALDGPAAGLEHDLRGLLHGLVKARDGLVAAMAANGVTREALAKSDGDLDRMIEELLEMEREMVATRERQAALSAELERDTVARSPDLRPVAQRIAALLDDICVDVLEALRDRRWDAMAVRADRAPTGEPGELIDTPEGVHAWFASLEDDA